jgi:hypothetical protein
LNCFFCGQDTSDLPDKRRMLNDTAEYVVTNPGAQASIAGFQWPVFASIDISFGEQVVKFLRAHVEERDHGNSLPMQEFWQKQLARTRSLHDTDRYVAVLTEPYVPTETRKDFVFLTVDCQKDLRDFWYVVRTWNRAGESWQLDRGRVGSWEEVSAVQAKWQVLDQCCFFDLGYEQTRVARECVKHGHFAQVHGRKRWFCWVGLKGSGLNRFTHRIPLRDGGTRVEYRIYSECEYLNPQIGLTNSTMLCPMFNWSNLHFKDILAAHRDRRAAKFVALTDDDQNAGDLGYNRMMNAEFRFDERSKTSGQKVSVWRPIRSRPNHFFDAEAMQFVAAALNRIIGEPTPEKEDSEQKEKT